MPAIAHLLAAAAPAAIQLENLSVSADGRCLCPAGTESVCPQPWQSCSAAVGTGWQSLSGRPTCCHGLRCAGWSRQPRVEQQHRCLGWLAKFSFPAISGSTQSLACKRILHKALHSTGVCTPSAVSGWPSLGWSLAVHPARQLPRSGADQLSSKRVLPAAWECS